MKRIGKTNCVCRYALPPQVVASLSKQGVLNQPVNENADYPKDIGEIAHLSRQYKKQTTPKEQQSSQVNEQKAVTRVDQKAVSTVTRGGVTIHVTVDELVKLHRSVTAQLKSLSNLSELVDSVIMAKVATGSDTTLVAEK